MRVRVIMCYISGFIHLLGVIEFQFPHTWAAPRTGSEQHFSVYVTEDGLAGLWVSLRKNTRWRHTILKITCKRVSEAIFCEGSKITLFTKVSKRHTFKSTLVLSFGNRRPRGKKRDNVHMKINPAWAFPRSWLAFMILLMASVRNPMSKFVLIIENRCCRARYR